MLPPRGWAAAGADPAVELHSGSAQGTGVTGGSRLWEGHQLILAAVQMPAGCPDARPVPGLRDVSPILESITFLV